MNEITNTFKGEGLPRESERHPGWVKGPDGWYYTYPNGEPPPPLDPNQTYVWITHDDDATCAVCAPLHGTLYGKTWTRFPPVHPNCRCTIALISKPK